MIRRRIRSRILVVCIVAVLAIVVTVAGLASHYQPLSLQTSWGEGNGHAASGIATTIQQSELRNGGLFGVTVLAVRQGVVTSSPRSSRLPSPQVCPVGTRYDGNCPQNSAGLFFGSVFHPLVVPGDGQRALLWTFTYNCRGISTGGYSGAEMIMPVTYRFLWFTHTVKLSSTADEMVSCQS